MKNRKPKSFTIPNVWHPVPKTWLRPWCPHHNYCHAPCARPRNEHACMRFPHSTHTQDYRGSRQIALDGEKQIMSKQLRRWALHADHWSSSSSSSSLVSIWVTDEKSKPQAWTPDPSIIYEQSAPSVGCHLQPGLPQRLYDMIIAAALIQISLINSRSSFRTPQMNYSSSWSRRLYCIEQIINVIFRSNDL